MKLTLLFSYYERTWCFRRVNFVEIIDIFLRINRFFSVVKSMFKIQPFLVTKVFGIFSVTLLFPSYFTKFTLSETGTMCVECISTFQIKAIKFNPKEWTHFIKATQFFVWIFFALGLHHIIQVRYTIVKKVEAIALQNELVRRIFWKFQVLLSKRHFLS